eukprot:m.233657 g.233657  ORF g.233657 m.233657 type:complete len:414 (+) comp33644_c1_seq2:658-1899(+)
MRDATDAVIIKDEETIPQEACAPGYQWSQTPSTLTISFDVPSDVTVMGINVMFKTNEIMAGVEGCDLRVSGTLHQEVNESECTWEREAKQGRAVVNIHLHKAVAIEWQVPIKAGRYTDEDMDPQSNYELGKYFARTGDVQRALLHMEAAAAAHLILARVHLGKMYHSGHDGRYPLKADVWKARYHYEIAAAKHSGEAHFLLGAMYLHGDSPAVVKDHKKSEQHFQRCISTRQITYDFVLCQRTTGPDHNKVHEHALFNLGIIYQQGKDGVVKNLEKGRDLWRQAATLGFAPALYNLGVIYLRGMGVPQDLHTAEEYFKQANVRNPSLAIPEIPFSDEVNADEHEHETNSSDVASVMKEEKTLNTEHQLHEDTEKPTPLLISSSVVLAIATVAVVGGYLMRRNRLQVSWPPQFF